MKTYWIKCCQKCGKYTIATQHGRTMCRFCKSASLDYGFKLEAESPLTVIEQYLKQKEGK